MKHLYLFEDFRLSDDLDYKQKQLKIDDIDIQDEYGRRKEKEREEKESLNDIGFFNWLEIDIDDLDRIDEDDIEIIEDNLKDIKYKLTKYKELIDHSYAEIKTTILIYTAQMDMTPRIFKVLTYIINAGANWNLRDENNKTFFDYLDDETKEKIIKKYPKKYQKYLLISKANKYNIY
jgi:hypothetical protein